jgi:hypothetical protein
MALNRSLRDSEGRAANPFKLRAIVTPVVHQLQALIEIAFWVFNKTPKPTIITPNILAFANPFP